MNDTPSGADVVSGASLFKDDGLETLVGIPMLLHSVTFRTGTFDKARGYAADYVSVEALIADETELRRAMKRGQFTATQAELLQPEENIILNDGSTGIYRQLVKHLCDKGLIGIPEGPDTGEKGESRWDVPRSQWLGSAIEITRGDDDALSDTAFPVRLYCPRGLRKSEYVSPVNPRETARTYYLA